MRRKTLFTGLLSLFVPLLIIAQQQTERIDLNVIHQIKTAEIGGGSGGRGAPSRPCRSECGETVK
jgi:hypothetical protein